MKKINFHGVFLLLALASILSSCSKQGQLLVQKNRLIRNMAADSDVRMFIAASALQTQLLLSPFNQTLPSQEEIEKNGMPEFKKPLQADIEAKVKKVLFDNFEQTKKVITMGTQIAQKYNLLSYSQEERQDIIRQVWMIVDSDAVKKLSKPATRLN